MPQMICKFRDNPWSRLTLVLINNADSPRAIDINLSGLRLSGVINGEQSTEAAYWQPLAAFAPNDANRFVVTVPARSVTTLVGQVAN